jgi:hypothetical protein
MPLGKRNSYYKKLEKRRKKYGCLQQRRQG